MSRIYWNGKFLDYPLSGMDVVRKLGPVELFRSGMSYLWAAAKPKGREDNFEQWVSNRFGKRLYHHFFKTYTEKVWGVPTTELRAEWAAQRIKGLSFFSAAKAAFFGNRGNKIKSLISEFHYPRFGPGQMWETMADEIIAAGGEVRLNAPVEKLEVRDGRILAIEAGGERIEPGEVISSLPLRATVGLAGAAADGTVQTAAQGLRYRDFLTVALVIDGEDLFPDNWIYIHEPDVRVGRIQNYRSWSPWMVPDQSKACVGLEYFCFQGDDLWDMPDEQLVELAKDELAQLGLVAREKVERGFVTRVPLAYPMYDADYADRVAVIRTWLEGLRNLQQVGRNGCTATTTPTTRCSRRSARSTTSSTARSTTCGPSTPSRSTTRPTSPTSSPTGARPRPGRCASRSSARPGADPPTAGWDQWSATWPPSGVSGSPRLSHSVSPPSSEYAS
jgi:protoporphyrinogen oxidase